MSELKRHAAIGVRWTALSTIITTILQFIQLAVLGRLLDPKAFGLMAMVMIVIGFAQLFSQMGLSEALIQRKAPTTNELSSLYWLNIASGAVVCFVVWGITPLIAKGFGTPELKSILPFVAVSFAIAPFGTQFQALMQKSLRFNILAVIEITYVIINTSLSIILAWFGLGVWSLIWGNLIGMIVRTSILIKYGWNQSTRPQFYFHWPEVAEYFRFGLYRVGAMSTNYFNSRTDQIFLGAVLGAETLGYYSMAVNLVLMPIQKINPLVTRVAFPVFSQVQDDIPRLQRGYLQMVRLLMFMNAPILIGLSAVASLAIPLVLGEQWKSTVPLVQVLAFYALIRSLGNAGGSLILALGRADWTLYWNLLLIFVVPPIVYFGSLKGGVIYITGLLVTMQVLLALAHYFVFIRRLIGRCFGMYLQAIGIPTLLAVAMGIIIISLKPLLESLPNLLALGIQILTGICSYVVFLGLFQRKYINEILIFLPKPAFVLKFLKRWR